MSYKPSVAILGVSSALGQYTLKALELPFLADKIQFPVKAVTRDASKKTNTAAVQYVQADLTAENADKVAEALAGTDVIIELLGFNPATFAVVETVVKAVKPKVFIPSQFGVEINKVSYFPGFLEAKEKHSAAIRALGVKSVDIIPSFFADEGSYLYEIVAHVGIDAAAKTVTYFGSPDTKFSYTKLEDVGKVVASVASIPPSELPDKVRVEAEQISFKEFASRYEKKNNVTLTAKNVDGSYLQEAQEKYKNFSFNDFLYYLQVIASQGTDKGASFSSNENELVNPGAKNWTWTTY